MLRATMAHADAWNAWFVDIENRPTGVPAVRTLVDAACREVGRNPDDIERTVAVLVRMPGGSGRPAINPEHALLKPLGGDPAELADTLRAYAREGIAHVQLVVDPITTASIRALGPVVTELERDG